MFQDLSIVRLIGGIMIKIAICDDDIKTTAIIEEYIYKFETLNPFEIDVHFSGEKLLSSIQMSEGKYDLIFLDVEMDKLNGIDTAHKIREVDKNCLIIFITTYIKFAPSAFEVNAFRFLPKPIDEKKLKKYYLAAVGEIIKTPKYFRYTFKRENFKVLMADVLFFESMQRQTYISLEGGTRERCYMKLNEVEEHLANNNIFFYRVSQSLLVNPKHVFSYMHNRMVLKDGTELQVSTNRRKKVTEIFCKIKGGEIID